MKTSQSQTLNTKIALLAGGIAISAGLNAQAGGSAQSPMQNRAVASETTIVVENNAYTATFVGGTAKAGGQLKVRINGPDGQTVYDARSAAGILDWQLDQDLPDGQYRWDAWFTSEPSAGQPLAKLEGGKYEAKPRTQYRSGTFTVQNGSLVPTAEFGTGEQANVSWPERALGALLNALVPEAAAVTTANDGVNVDDTATDNSTFVQLQNDGFSGNGLCNQGGDLLIFVDGDCAGGVSEIVVEASAPDHSIFVESTGEIGLGTSTPNEEFHIVDSSEPGIRLEDSSNGEEWQIIQTNNGGLEFDSEGTTSADNIIRLDPNGNVGLGTGTFDVPAKQLHVQGASADTLGQNNTMLQVENTSGTSGPRRMIELINNGSPLLVYRDTSRGTIWNMSPVGNSFAISLTGTGAQEFQMDGGGNLTIQGSLTENSRRSAKDGFAPVDSDTVLSKLERLPIEEWSYKHTPGSRHLGPMAEDFHATFGLGPDNGIAPRDLAGVALAAAKALKEENNAKERRISALEAQVAELRAAIAELQAR